ncbi:MAG: efflux transporter, family, subunit [Reyranella sp.]|nr:efflux transporter, family, subunit [Reyranella sp.]
MSKSMFTLAAALAVVAFSPLSASQVSATTLPSIHEADENPDLDTCTLEAPNDARLASGRVVAVDPAAGRITLDYRPLPFLPEGGVRVFTVEDPALLKGLGAGDRVRFEVERDGRGFVVTHLENSN